MQPLPLPLLLLLLLAAPGASADAPVLDEQHLRATSARFAPVGVETRFVTAKRLAGR